MYILYYINLFAIFCLHCWNCLCTIDIYLPPEASNNLYTSQQNICFSFPFFSFFFVFKLKAYKIKFAASQAIILCLFFYSCKVCERQTVNQPTSLFASSILLCASFTYINIRYICAYIYFFNPIPMFLFYFLVFCSFSFSYYSHSSLDFIFFWTLKYVFLRSSLDSCEIYGWLKRWQSVIHIDVYKFGENLKATGIENAGTQQG